MTDIHTHLIPGIDDGSQTVEETRLICEAMQAQGVDRIIATPHFYADSEDPENFIRKRNEAFETIRDLADEYHVIKGAEVRYFTGIGMSENIDMLLIDGTNFLLLELADKKVNGYVLDDLMELRSRNIRPIIAHLNRYREFHDDRFIEFCNMNGMPIQLNTESLMYWYSRRRAMELIGSGRAQFLATDCHDLTARKPDLKEAFDIVRTHLGNVRTDDFIEYGERILAG